MLNISKTPTQLAAVEMLKTYVATTVAVEPARNYVYRVLSLVAPATLVDAPTARAIYDHVDATTSGLSYHEQRIANLNADRDVAITELAAAVNLAILGRLSDDTLVEVIGRTVPTVVDRSAAILREAKSAD